MWFLKLLSRLPFNILFFFSDFLFVLVYHGVGYRKRLVRSSLERSFPELTRKELRRIEKDFYRNLCDYGVETLKLLTITKSELKKRMRYVNPELMGTYTARGQSVLLFPSHHFNWEWLLVSGSISLPAPVDFVYQPVKNSFFDALIMRVRTQFGAHPVERNEIARNLILRKHLIRGIAVVADQYPGQGGDKRYHLTFLHQRTAFFYASQQAAWLTQCPALYASVEKVARGYYTCTFVPIGTPPYDRTDVSVVTGYAQAVEENIRRNPSLWLWSHNRWKNR